MRLHIERVRVYSKNIFYPFINLPHQILSGNSWNYCPLILDLLVSITYYLILLSSRGWPGKVNDSPIYLQGPKVAKGETSGEGSNQDGPQAKKHASDKKISADRKKLLKDKKRTLKRLWVVFMKAVCATLKCKICVGIVQWYLLSSLPLRLLFWFSDVLWLVCMSTQNWPFPFP